MDFGELLRPNSKKLWIALILFLVLPTIIISESEVCPEESGYDTVTVCGTIGFISHDEVCGEPPSEDFSECRTVTMPNVIPFYGLMWFGAMLLDVFVGEFTLFFELLPSFLIHIAVSYAVACIFVAYLAKSKAAPVKKLKK